MKNLRDVVPEEVYFMGNGKVVNEFMKDSRTDYLVEVFLPAEGAQREGRARRPGPGP